MADEGVLRAPLVIEYPFTRTIGPVLGAFFTGLREGIVLGVRGSDGRVLVPPCEYDPVTSDELTELVEVTASGEVTTWAWIAEPRSQQPLDRPFAWALIRLDGADTALVHAVDTGGDVGALSTGMRVAARWRDPGAREGSILDIACFEPEVDQ